MQEILETLVKELCIDTTSNTNSTYTPCTESFDELLKTHAYSINFMGLEMSEEGKKLPCLYWTPSLHKTLIKHRFIAGSNECTTKDLSCHFTTVLSTIKDGLIRYHATKTNRSGVNNM